MGVSKLLAKVFLKVNYLFVSILLLGILGEMSKSKLLRATTDNLPEL